MEVLKILVWEVAVPLSRYALEAAAAVMAGLLVVAWCLLVLILTGRLPWFVRKYL